MQWSSMRQSAWVLPAFCLFIASGLATVLGATPYVFPEGGIRDDQLYGSILLVPSEEGKLLEALAAFEAKHGKALAGDLKKQFDGYFDQYRDSTMATARTLLEDKSVSPAERIFEVELFLRSRQSEWTVGAFAEYFARKGVDILRDKVIEGALNYYLGGVPAAVSAILKWNTFGTSVIPKGASNTFAEDAYNLWKAKNHTQLYADVRTLMRDSRTQTRDQLTAYVDAVQEENRKLTEASEHTIHQEFMRNVREICRASGMNEQDQQRGMQYAAGVLSEADRQAFERNMQNKFQKGEMAADSGRIKFRIWLGKCGIARSEALELAMNAVQKIAVNNLKIQAIKTRLDAKADTGIVNSIVILIDASGSMKDSGKIDSAKTTASRRIAGLGPETELAVIAFSGSGTTTPFLTMTPQGRAQAQAAVEGISASGGTPLAAGIRRAGGYLRGQAQGKNLTLIILSDGDETEGGDPPAEIGRLNDLSVVW